MAHGVDHIVLPVEDLDIARCRLASLGFAVAPDARHPFGTENACVFFANRTYLEPLAVANRMEVEGNARAGMVFLRRYQAYRFRHGLEGAAMIAFSTDDANADRARFDAAGFSGGPVFPFERKSATSNGETTVGVRLAFGLDEMAPDFTPFCCQHINTESFWAPDRTCHPNGAAGIDEVILTEENPSDFQYLLQAATDMRDDRASSFGLHFDLPKARVSMLSPAGYEALFGEVAPNVGRGPRIAAFAVAVADLAGTVAHLQAGDVAFHRRSGAVIVPPAPGQGVVIVFRESQQ